ncbi:ATP-binding protein [Candidatus Magnetomonas plexicatena]|uniref:ATP-binding protein n=1 Tax=Candidatus Magnetomonas plexicatena TaxID=2552947 RepID=UPI004032BE68
MIKRLFFIPSIKIRLILMMMLLTIIVTASLVFFNLQLEKNLLMQVERQTGELTKAIQIGVEEITGRSDKARLSKYLNDLNKKGIKEISIISTDSKEILASTNQQKVGAPVSHRKKELVIKAELGEHVSDDEKNYNVIVPIVADGQQYGYIHLIINKDDLSSIIKQNTMKRIFMTMLVFSIATLITLVFSRRYTLPIKQIVDASRRISAGDLNQHIPVHSNDEIGQLADSFNYMAEKLRESRNLEDKLHDAQHLAGLVQLTRDMAHEIRNPLNFINLSIDYINDKFVPPVKDDAKQFANLVVSIKHEIQRLNKFVNGYLDFSRPITFTLEPLRINSVLEDVISLIWAKAEAEGISIIRDYDDDIELRVDRDFLKTCILNIITNAFQAMSNTGKAGTLRISTLHAEEFMLSICDNGSGISEGNINKVFEPFFSTKQNHPGLGLPMTQRVMEEHGGRVEIESKEGEGTEVRLILPCPCKKLCPES